MTVHLFLNYKKENLQIKSWTKMVRIFGSFPLHLSNTCTAVNADITRSEGMQVGVLLLHRSHSGYRHSSHSCIHRTRVHVHMCSYTYINKHLSLSLLQPECVFVYVCVCVCVCVCAVKLEPVVRSRDGWHAQFQANLQTSALHSALRCVRTATNHTSAPT